MIDDLIRHKNLFGATTAGEAFSFPRRVFNMRILWYSKGHKV